MAFPGFMSQLGSVHLWNVYALTSNVFVCWFWYTFFLRSCTSSLLFIYSFIAEKMEKISNELPISLELRVFKLNTLYKYLGIPLVATWYSSLMRMGCTMKLMKDSHLVMHCLSLTLTVLGSFGRMGQEKESATPRTLHCWCDASVLWAPLYRRKCWRCVPTAWGLRWMQSLLSTKTDCEHAIWVVYLSSMRRHLLILHRLPLFRLEWDVTSGQGYGGVRCDLSIKSSDFTQVCRVFRWRHYKLHLHHL